MPFGMFPDTIPFSMLSSDYAFSYVAWHNAFLVCFLRIMPFRMFPGIIRFGMLPSDYAFSYVP